MALCVGLSSIVQSASFQVQPDPTNSFKNAIEKTTKQQPIVFTDDKTHSPAIRSPISKKNDETIQQSFPNDDMITISDFLRIDHKIRNDPPVTLPLYKSVVTKTFISPQRNAIARNRFKLDDKPSEYWFDNRIHSFGNTGIFGGLHAAVAPLVTKLIDNSAYDGEDVRTRVSKKLSTVVNKPNARIIDLCCGVGMSTRALLNAFPNADMVCGVDTSPEMIGMARYINKYQEVQGILKKFKISGDFMSNISNLVTELKNTFTSTDPPSNLQYTQGNAERIKVPSKSFDLVTIMYAFHEIPRSARYRILREARRLLKDNGTLAVIDISTDYNSSPPMLVGEPYVLEYQQNIMQQMGRIQGFCDFKSEIIVPGHVHMWSLTRQKSKTNLSATTYTRKHAVFV